jgi:hypothetical protein
LYKTPARNLMGHISRGLTVFFRKNYFLRSSNLILIKIDDTCE